jgi:hypothetical protein
MACPERYRGWRTSTSGYRRGFDEAILGVYLSGTNSRRLRGALAPLLRGAPLSKDAVSRPRSFRPVLGRRTGWS